MRDQHHSYTHYVPIRWPGNDPLMRQLYELDSPVLNSIQSLVPSCPALWRHRSKITIQSTIQSFQEEMGVGKKCRVLAEFLKMVRTPNSNKMANSNKIDHFKKDWV